VKQNSSSDNIRFCRSSSSVESASCRHRIAERSVATNPGSKGAEKKFQLKSTDVKQTSHSGPGPRRNSCPAKGHLQIEQTKQGIWKRFPEAVHIRSVMGFKQAEQEGE